LNSATEKVSLNIPAFYEWYFLQIQELNDQLIRLQQEFYQKDTLHSKELIPLKSECEALKEENHSLSELLAQRTVLYAAQERRFFNDQRVWGTIRSNHEEEIIRLKAKLQHLESQYSSVSHKLPLSLILFILG
jgi:hypothetical protein